MACRGTRIDSISTVGDQLWVGDRDRCRGGRRSTECASWVTRTRTPLGARADRVRGRDLRRDLGRWDQEARRDGSLTTVAFRGGTGSRSTTRPEPLADSRRSASRRGAVGGPPGGCFRMRERAGSSSSRSRPARTGDVAVRRRVPFLWIATTAGLYAREGTTLRGYGGGDLRRVTRVDGEIVAAGLGWSRRPRRFAAGSRRPRCPMRW